jgi:hypothetical protein
MHKSLRNSQLEPRHNQILFSEKKCILKLLRGIRRRNIAKITPNYSMPHNHLFSQVDPSQILNTTLGWTFKFQEEIEKADEWDLLLSISEKGRFLKSCKDLDFMENKKVELVLSSFDYPEEVLPNISPNVEELLEKFPTLSNQYNFLPWWLHNKHMVLLLKRKENADNIIKERDKWSLVSGFYYESRMLSRRVNPVFVENEDDLEVMLYTFTNYWYRAREYTKTLGDPKRENVVPIIQRKDEIDQYREDLLGLWDASSS